MNDFLIDTISSVKKRITAIFAYPVTLQKGTLDHVIRKIFLKRKQLISLAREQKKHAT